MIQVGCIFEDGVIAYELYGVIHSLWIFNDKNRTEAEIKADALIGDCKNSFSLIADCATTCQYFGANFGQLTFFDSG